MLAASQARRNGDPNDPAQPNWGGQSDLLYSAYVSGNGYMRLADIYNITKLNRKSTPSFSPTAPARHSALSSCTARRAST
jgi:hypothetical protein